MIQKIASFFKKDKSSKGKENKKQDSPKQPQTIEEKQKIEVKEEVIDPKWIVFQKLMPQNLSNKVCKKLDLRTVKLNWKQWNKCDMANVCEFIDEWKASEIWGSYNSAPKFFKEINHIQFCNLTNLCVSDSEIESIESIHRIQFPKLNTLYLSENRLHNMKQLSKVYLPEIESLLIDNNKILNGEQFTRQKQSKVNLISFETINNPSQCNDVRWLAKMQSPAISSLSLGSQHRIRMKKLKAALERKKKGVKITIDIPFEEKKDDGLMRYTMDM